MELAEAVIGWTRWLLSDLTHIGGLLAVLFLAVLIWERPWRRGRKQTPP